MYPTVPPQPVTPIPEKQKNPLLIIIVIIILFLSLGAAGFLTYQNTQLKQQISQMQPTETPLITPITTPDPMANWKTYKYQQIFELKVPSVLNIVDKGYGRIEIGDYLSIGIYQSNPEDCRGDCSIIETKEDKTTNSLKTRYLSGWWGEIGGNIAQSYIEYVIPHNGKFIYLQMQELPFSTTTSPIREKVGKVSENNSQLLDQILSTFKFIDNIPSQAVSPISTSNWDVYESSLKSYSFKHPPGLKSDTGAAGVGFESIRFMLVGPTQMASGRTQTELFDGYAFIVTKLGSSTTLDPKKEIETQQKNSVSNCQDVGAVTSVIVAGKQAYQYAANCRGTYTTTYVSNGMNTYSITQSYAGGNQEAYKTITDQILSTFKFIE